MTYYEASSRDRSGRTVATTSGPIPASDDYYLDWFRSSSATSMQIMQFTAGESSICAAAYRKNDQGEIEQTVLDGEWVYR